MDIKFSDIKTRKERNKDIALELDFDDIIFEGEKISFNSKVKIQGTISFENEIINLNVNVKTDLKLVCSRCLDTFIYPIDIDIEERFTNNNQNSNDEIVFVENDIINIIEIVENAIISSLPIKRLCSEKCKGLCQSCGANLNKETCSCNYEDVDLRLVELKALLKNEEV
ncbi:MAG: DUF177 domain-containing protein [Clostridiales bacterium]|nr:DUF177 domain-containing protein [Clostridiales bacterium]